jgi:quinol monooxygenase YgiN
VELEVNAMADQPYAVGGDSPIFISIVDREIKPERLEYYLDRLQSVARRSAAEPGLLRCEVFSDPDEPHKITILDVFADEEAYQLHLQQDYLQIFRSQVSDCTVGGARQRILRFLGSEKNLMDPKP